MFKLIEPKNQDLQKPIINLFLRNIHKNPVLSETFPNPNNATFIVTEDTARGIHGGALLLKQNFTSLHRYIRKSLSSLASQNQEVWTCAVALHMENYSLVDHFEPFCKTFYQNLYEKFIEFGKQEKISFLCMILEPGEYLCTEVIGFWPYVVEVRPQESLDGLFHGILSLTYNPSQVTLKIMETRHTKTTKLAA
ncbi:MAG: hypothetical protein BGO67_07000 [Alphaproteobacteria bacterium 41-28]|nr:MAG: hypothetical protein BGO67_07000 [Alphaproteobacteria bacterium 41-28]